MELLYDLKATGPGVFALCGRLFLMSGSCVSLKGEDALVIAAVIAAGRRLAVRLRRRTLLALRLPRIPRRLIAHDTLPTRRRRPRSLTSENAPKVPVMRGNCEPDISP
jgi:hypothetical protein